MSKTVFFAGGGTGGHIYPGIAVAEKLRELQPDIGIHFLCSDRIIDADILNSSKFRYTAMPAREFYLNPKGFFRFFMGFKTTEKKAKRIISEAENPTVVGIGGFVAAPVCRAGLKTGAKVKLINVDIIPGKANKLAARWADEIFVQFEDTKQYSKTKRHKVTVTGCPLRKDFRKTEPKKIKDNLGLDKNKKTLLVTGASSGAKSINEAIIENLNNLEKFSDTWQIIHLTGRSNYNEVTKAYKNTNISHKIIDYYEKMADLLAATDLVIGRSGAVSVAEYAAANVPAICMPYPHHKDMHQYLNAEKLVLDGAAVMVDDLLDLTDRSEWLWEELQTLMADEEKLKDMRNAEKKAFKNNASDKIAEKIIAE